MITLYLGIGIIAVIVLVILGVKTVLVLKEEDTPEKKPTKKEDKLAEKRQKILVITGLIALIIGLAVFIASMFFPAKEATTSGSQVDTDSAAYTAGFIPAIWIPLFASRKKGEYTTKRQKLTIIGITWAMLLLLIAGVVAYYLATR